jgi:hypothetical protein
VWTEDNKRILHVTTFWGSFLRSPSPLIVIITLHPLVYALSITWQFAALLLQSSICWPWIKNPLALKNNLLVLVLHGTQFACAGTIWHTICLCWYYMAHNLLVLVLHGTQFACAGNTWHTICLCWYYMAHNLLVLVKNGTKFACAGTTWHTMSLPFPWVPLNIIFICFPFTHIASR